MKTGYIFLVHNPWYWKRPVDSLFYWLLRFITGYWHHCAIYWESQEGRFIVQANGKGVTVMDYEYWLTVWPNRVTKLIHREANIARITPFFGMKYDRKSLLIWCLIKQVTGQWFGPNALNSSKAWYCFELAGFLHDIPNWYELLPSEFISFFHHPK